MAKGSQHWDPERYARNARFVVDAGEAVVDLLAPRPGERILDLGCGDGALTQALATAGARVTGVDSSAEMVAAARALGLDARVMDGMALRFAAGFEGRFDAVFSNAALHWMDDLAAVIEGVARALKPGGRFVGEMGGEGNVATVADALGEALARRGLDPDRANPWTFPSPDAFARLLDAGGLEVAGLQLVPRPTVLPGDIEGWLETFAGSFLARVPPADRAAFVAEVREALRPRLRTAAGEWVADYVRLRFVARKPGPWSRKDAGRNETGWTPPPEMLRTPL